MANYNNADYYTDIISGRVEQLLKERFLLRKELAAMSDGNREQDNSFVEAFMSRVAINEVRSMKSARLAYLLRVIA